jgi:hypothetical protein
VIGVALPGVQVHPAACTAGRAHRGRYGGSGQGQPRGFRTAHRPGRSLAPLSLPSLPPGLLPLILLLLSSVDGASDHRNKRWYFYDSSLRRWQGSMMLSYVKIGGCVRAGLCLFPLPWALRSTVPLTIAPVSFLEHHCWQGCVTFLELG